ncbi:hypothetical protein A2U01_0021072 [Trifolium medium]|uniref:Uncharacterized protein n=1 Tax=Trifolium medium TaxID=97028 RepID=A0A392NLS7_9FABA|nr:hypothetical protein [Trifolium medium]
MISAIISAASFGALDDFNSAFREVGGVAQLVKLVELRVKGVGGPRVKS